MATLTGAQLIATGKIHAAILANTEELERKAVEAGLASGDLCYPLLYAPELLKSEFSSKVADMKLGWILIIMVPISLLLPLSSPTIIMSTMSRRGWGDHVIQLWRWWWQRRRWWELLTASHHHITWRHHPRTSTA